MAKSLIVIEAVIPAGQALSDPVDISAGPVVGIVIPPGWAAAPATVQASPTGEDFFDLYDGDTELTFSAVPDAIHVIDPDRLRSAKAIRLRSGISRQPIPQQAEQVIELIIEQDAAGTGEEGEAPVIDSLNPTSAQSGAPDLQLHVLGSGFTPDSVVVFNGSDRPTTFYSAVQLAIMISPASHSAGPVPVTVRNGEAVSNQATFNFTAARR